MIPDPVSYQWQVRLAMLFEPTTPAPPPAVVTSPKVAMVAGISDVRAAFAADPVVLVLVIRSHDDCGVLVACRTVGAVGQILPHLPKAFCTPLTNLCGYRLVLVPKGQPEQVLRRLSEKFQ